MPNARYYRPQYSVQPKPVGRCFTLQGGNQLMAVIVCALSLMGCVAQPALTQDVYPTRMASSDCILASVFTAEDMQTRVDCHPDDYKIVISEDTAVLFAYPDPMIDWVGPIFVIHIPSVSEVVLDTDGKIVFDGHKSPEGRKAIEDVLDNQELMDSILQRAKEIEKERQPRG